MGLKLVASRPQRLVVMAKFGLRRAIELKDIDSGRLFYAELSSGVAYDRFTVGQTITLNAKVGG